MSDYDWSDLLIDLLTDLVAGFFCAGAVHTIWKKSTRAILAPQKRRTRKELEEEKEYSRWSLLPEDLLIKISDLLLVDVTLGDYIRFRAVTVSWRSATADLRDLRLPPQGPLLLTSYKHHGRFYLRISDQKKINLYLPNPYTTDIIGSSDGLLVLLNRKCRTITLLNPVTNTEIIFPAIPSCFERGDPVWTVPFYERSQWRRGTIVFLFRPSFLCYARENDSEWTIVYDTNDDEHIIDMACYQGQLYKIDSAGRFVRIVLGPINKTFHIRFMDYNHIVEVAGSLLVIGKRFRPTTIIFKLGKVEGLGEEGKPSVVKIDSLGDWAVFIGNKRSIGLDTKEYPGWRRNCIYFIFDDVFRLRTDCCRINADDRILGVYSLDDCSISYIPPHTDFGRSVWPPPMWFTPETMSLGRKSCLTS